VIHQATVNFLTLYGNNQGYDAHRVNADMPAPGNSGLTAQVIR
jgi:hypothetical protein